MYERGKEAGAWGGKLLGAGGGGYPALRSSRSPSKTQESLRRPADAEGETGRARFTDYLFVNTNAQDPQSKMKSLSRPAMWQGVKIVVKTEREIAYESPDHLMPWGTKQDNSRNHRFNDKLYQALSQAATTEGVGHGLFRRRLCKGLH